MTSSGSTSPSDSMTSSHCITTAKFPSSFISPVEYKATHGALPPIGDSIGDIIGDI